MFGIQVMDNSLDIFMFPGNTADLAQQRMVDNHGTWHLNIEPCNKLTNPYNLNTNELAIQIPTVQLKKC